MKNAILFRLLSLAALLLFGAVALIAQNDTIIVPDPIGPGGQLQDFLDLYGALEGVIIVVAGYLHNFIPGLNMISSKWIRILLIGAVVAVIFAALGLNSGIGTALVFLQSVGFYELILKKVKPSPAVKQKTA